MDTGLMYIPAPGYGLVRRIKELDGRLDFLKTWTDEIKNHVKAEPAYAVGMEFGDRRLRVSRTPETTRRTFDYAAFVRENGREIRQRYVKVVPPKYPKSMTLGAAKIGASREWVHLSEVGVQGEAAQFPGRAKWKQAAPRVVASGILTLLDRMKPYEDERAELRDALLRMALEEDWTDRVMGKSDGRIFFRDTKPSYVPAPGVERDALLRQFPKYVKATTQKPRTTVGFYPIGSTED